MFIYRANLIKYKWFKIVTCVKSGVAIASRQRLRATLCIDRHVSTVCSSQIKPNRYPAVKFFNRTLVVPSLYLLFVKSLSSIPNFSAPTLNFFPADLSVGLCQKFSLTMTRKSFSSRLLFAFRSILPSLPIQNAASLPPIQACWRAAGRSVTWVGRVEGKRAEAREVQRWSENSHCQGKHTERSECKYKKITVVWHGIPPHLILIPEHQQSWSAQKKSSKAAVGKKNNKKNREGQMLGRSSGRFWTFIFIHFPVFRSEKIKTYRELFFWKNMNL